MLTKYIVFISFVLSCSTFAFDQVVIRNAGSPQHTKLADLNGDGLVDVVAGDMNDEEFLIYLQTKKRNFEQKGIVRLKELHPETFSWSFELGNFDSDNNIDLLIFNDSKVSYYYQGKGDGSFSSGKILKNGPPTDQLGLKVNLDNDGKDDLLVTPNMIFVGNFGIETQRNLGIDGNFQYESKKSLIDVIPVLKENNLLEEKIEIDNIAYGDFNGDGYKDLVAVCTMYDFIMTFNGSKEGKFSFGSFNWTYSGPTSPGVMDIDGDGTDELLIGHYKNNNSLIYFNENGNFRLQQSIETGRYTTGFHIEKKEDGNRLAALNYFDGSLKFYSNYKKTYVERLPNETVKLGSRIPVEKFWSS